MSANNGSAGHLVIWPNGQAKVIQLRTEEQRRYEELLSTLLDSAREVLARYGETDADVQCIENLRGAVQAVERR